jgi:hypothetical protein
MFDLHTIKSINTWAADCIQKKKRDALATKRAAARAAKKRAAKAAAVTAYLNDNKQ